MSAARQRSRLLKAMCRIASTTGTMPAFFLTSMCWITPLWRNFCLSDFAVALSGVVLSFDSLSFATGHLLQGCECGARNLKAKATAARYGVRREFSLREAPAI